MEERIMSTEHVDVLIVGGGQAGLDMSYSANPVASIIRSG